MVNDEYSAPRDGDSRIYPRATVGMILGLSHDESDDYRLRYIVRVRRDFVPAEVLETWLTAHPVQRNGYTFDWEAFRESLFAQGYLEDIPWKELWFGGSGCAPDWRTCDDKGWRE